MTLTFCLHSFFYKITLTVLLLYAGYAKGLTIPQKSAEKNTPDTITAALLEKATENIGKDPRAAREFALKALAFAESKEEPHHQYTAWHTLGIIEFYSGSYSEALKNYLNALRIAEDLKDTAAMSRTCNNMGILMEKSGDTEAALSYYLKALRLYESSSDADGIAAALNNLGNIYQEMDSLTLAMDYYRKVMEIRRQLGDSLYLAYCYGNIGNLYLKQNELLKAEEFYGKGLDIFDQLHDTAALARSYMNIAIVKRNRKNYQEVKQLLGTGLEMAEKVNDKALIALYCETMSETYSQTGEFEKAYNWRIRYENAHKSYLNQENMRQINEMQVMYEAESKEKEIQLLKKEDELQEIKYQQQTARLQRTRFLALFLVIFTILILVSGYLMARSYRLSQKARFIREKIRNREDQIQTIIKTQEAERNRFAKDLHDGLGQYLTALKMSIFNYKNGYIGKEEKETDENFEQVLKLFNDIYSELRNISFNIMPQELQQNGLVAATEELADKWNKSGKMSMNFFSYGVTKRLKPNHEIAVYRIQQELINNAIKHSHSDQISITFTEHEKELNIIVETNGKGFNRELLKKSMGSGWKNIQSRIEMMNGHLEIDSSPQSSNNSFIFDIPLNNE
ncbi:MAG: tetratricopeptide repeat protein [Bacteroidetes bacterium]|jgi:two-component system NarL family sensor kinase|nr:tetratricopeptide repeat protein [Bacteroidota bacterium]